MATLATVGGKITAALFNQLVKAVNGQALTGIVPTGVSGGTLNPGGSVQFINSTAVSLDGVFSGTFDAYRILIQSNNRSAASSTQFHLRSAGADIGTQYAFTKSVANGTGTTVSASTSAGSWPLDDGLAIGQLSFITMDVVYPATSTQTIANIQATNITSSMSTCVIGGANYGTSAHDGFSLYPLASGANFSGIVRVYGYNQLT